MASANDARKELEKKAKKFKVEFDEKTTDEELAKLVSEKEALAKQQEEEKRIQEENEKRAAEFAKKNDVVLRDTSGNDVDPRDYFFWNPTDELKARLKPGEEIKPYPTYFNKICGLPVDREELLDVFHQIFNKDDGFLFYKLRDKELYLVIVPLKKAKTISVHNESAHGDFQRHAISFINEGSVNIESLTQKLKKVATHSTIGEK